MMLNKKSKYSDSGTIRSKRIIQLNPVQLAQWDEFVADHAFGTIYHLSTWKNVLERSFKHIKGIFFAIWDVEDCKIIGGLPMYDVKSMITGNRLVSAPFALYCDPLFTSTEDTALLFTHIFNMYRQGNISYVEVRARNQLDDSKFGNVSSNVHHFLPLDCEPTLLMKQFHKKAVRVPISKALKNNLELKIGETEEDLFQFYQIYYESRRRLGLPSIPYVFFRSLWQIFYFSGQLTLLLAIFENEVVGGSLLLKYNGIVHIEFGCDLIKYRKLFVNHFLDWEAVKLAYNEGYKLLSFGRTTRSNQGLRTYKNRWGTEEESLYKFFIPKSHCSTEEEKESSWKYKLIRRICENSPNSVFQAVSAFVYRHLG